MVNNQNIIVKFKIIQVELILLKKIIYIIAKAKKTLFTNTS